MVLPLLDVVLTALFLGRRAARAGCTATGSRPVPSGRPVLYRGERVGRGGRVFTMLKFLHVNADQRGPPTRPVPRRGAACSPHQGGVHADRPLAQATQLDEIPQFANVLRGDMSLVGPRPYPGCASSKSSRSSCPRTGSGSSARPWPSPASAGPARVRDVDGGKARPRPLQRIADRSVGLYLRTVAATGWRVIKQSAQRSRTARRLTVAGAVLLAVTLAAIAVWLLVVSPSPRRLLVGVDDDTLKWTSDPLGVVAAQRRHGADAVRVWVPWSGETAPGPVRRDELARAEQAATHTVVALAVFGFGSETPLTQRAQRRFCGYARAALARVPDARAVVVWNEANSKTYWRGSAAAYESLLAQCYDALHALRPDVVVLDSTASAHDPAAFLARLGAAYRASGRPQPLVDAFGHNPYPLSAREPAAARHRGGFLGEGDYPRLVSALTAAFAGTHQRSLDVWYLEDGFQAAVPRRLLHRYTGSETAATVAPAAQAARLRAAILLAACQPHVRAFFNFEFVDETRLAGWQSGLEWRGALLKPAAEAFLSAARTVAQGDVRCERTG